MLRRYGLCGALRICMGLLSAGSTWEIHAHAESVVATNQLELKVGDLFPNLQSFPLDGKVPTDLKGNVAIIDFWASWCAPCQRTFPVMEDLYFRFRKQGLVEIGRAHV